MKNEYGITAIKLIFTVIILAVIIIVAVFVAKKFFDDSTVKDIKTDLLYIQGKCKVIHDKNIIDTNEQLKGEKITEFSENSQINDWISEGDYWYKLGQEDLEAIGAKGLNAEDGFIVNYETEEVIYVKGVKENEEIYYRLSDMVKEEE